MAPAAFDSLIEALDVAYDVKGNRRSGRQPSRVSAISGGLLLAALDVMVVGPRSGEWLAAQRALNYVRCSVAIPSLAMAISFTVVVVEVLGVRGKTLPSLLVPSARVEPVGREHIGKAASGARSRSWRLRHRQSSGL